jgi:hypothetical protein
MQKKPNDMFTSFVDGITNKVDICRVLRELEQLQQQFNECDVEWIVNSISINIFNNDLTEMDQIPSGPQLTNPRRFGLALVGGPSKNPMELDSLSLPNFPTQNHTSLSMVPQLVLYVPPL